MIDKVIRKKPKLAQKLLSATLVFFVSINTALSCTSFVLLASDGSPVYGRTMEWGMFDLKSRLVIVPRGHVFTGHTPEGENGLQFEAKYGAVAIDALEKDILTDGMNEKGLVVGVLYHPGFAEYQAYEADSAKISMGSLDLAAFLLSQFATVEEVSAGLKPIRVVAVPEPSIGNIPAPLHWLVTDQSGRSIVIEYQKGELHVYDNPLRVLTNSPNFDWHMTNLRNYLFLSPSAHSAKKLGEVDVSPLGGGSGFIGLPGDYTPPSRFIRAVTFTQTARKTADGPETVYEALRILDSFNVPLGAAEGSDEASEIISGLRSATTWTSVADSKSLKYYYHTQHNRRLRLVDLKKINFSTDSTDLIHLKLDKEKAQDIEEIYINDARLPL